MKHWQESYQVFSRLVSLMESGHPAVLATIISIEGSTYRRPGAKLLLSEQGKDVGNVSGGCLEEDIAATAEQVLKARQSRTAFYDTSDEGDLVFGMGLGCNGKIELHLQPYFPGAQGTLQASIELLKGHDFFMLGRLISDDVTGTVLLAPGQEPVWSDGFPEEHEAKMLMASDKAGAAHKNHLEEVAPGLRLFVECFNPPPSLAVCGAGDDALPLVRIAAEAGFRVWVLDHRSGYLEESRFPDAFGLVKCRPDEGLPAAVKGGELLGVLKTHTYQLDLAWLQLFSEANACYIGLLGPKSRCLQVQEAAGVSDADPVFAPVGLDIGGDGPEHIALSTVAEMLAVYHERQGGFLKDREGAIH